MSSSLYPSLTYNLQREPLTKTKQANAYPVQAASKV